MLSGARSFARTTARLALARPTAPIARAARHLSGAASDDFLSPLTGLSPEAQEYYNVAKAFADNEFAPHAAKWDEEHFFPEEALRKAAGLGFGGLYVSPDFGGSGMTREDSMPVIEALASADTSTTAYLTIHNMCAWMIDKFASKQLKEQWLPSLITMEKFASYCLTEPNAGSDAASLQTRAVREGDEYVLNGSKAFISGGGRSDVYVVMCRTGAPNSGAKGISCVLVPKDAPGLSFGKQERKLGWNSQPTAQVFFENVRIPVSNRLGEEGEGFKFAMRGLNGGRLSIAACSLGAASTCLDLALSHTQTRQQFGKPLSANQTVQFALADMAVQLQTSRMLVQRAARMLDENTGSAAAYCAMAKREATDKGFDICNQALQLHGGYGYLKDYPVERFLRDVRVHQILEGTNQVQTMIVAKSILQ